jgi:hypothetical protein
MYIIIVNEKESVLKFYAKNINDLVDFLIEYDIDFDVIKLDNNLANLNNFSLN